MNIYGLIGKSLKHSFSPGYFAHKFKVQDISNAEYKAFEIDDPTQLKDLIANTPNLKGLNVTIPYKESIIPYLDEVDELASFIKAVNTIKITDGKTKGYNTDIFGFGEALINRFLPRDFDEDALILGSGGVTKAVSYVLTELVISHKIISRSDKGDFTYEDLTPEMIEHHKLIINCTPLGMYPDVDSFPPIPYEGITKDHFVMDLVYNPEKTVFLEKAEQQGATIKNGMEMLTYQAEASWQIWNGKEGLV